MFTAWIEIKYLANKEPLSCHLSLTTKHYLLVLVDTGLH